MSLSTILSRVTATVTATSPTPSLGTLVATASSLATTALTTAATTALSIPSQLPGNGTGSTSGSGTTTTTDNATATSDKGKIVGLSLAIGSGLLIGSSFVFKKKGLINCTKNGMLAGEGHAYLKSTMWWTGMLMMVAGEVCNFIAYAFVQPILVTPLGALSVVICMQGKVGCAQCIVGATIIVLHAPEQTSVKTIQEFKHFMIQPIFLVWMILIIAGSLALIFKAGPRWGKEYMMVYIGVCSLIGSLSVVSTQGLGAAIVHNISTGENQFDNWFIYFVMVFMVVTLLTEINYLNKALNLFNTAMVTPTYYVTFTSTTIITSAILYQGFAASLVSILTVCLGFLVICGGVLLLQTSKPVVPLHIPGSSTAGIVVGTITYDDIEPTAADMRASPFSSIRRITRDFAGSRRPSSLLGGHSSVFQPSLLNPRAESLLQRKRRASNAAAQQAQAQAVAQQHGLGHWASRPTSMVSSNGGFLAVPGSGAVSSVSAITAATGGVTTATAGITSAFYPNAIGPYSTMVLGPNGAQIRLQLCEIVISDEKSETSRYQVYRPVPEDQLPHGSNISGNILNHRASNAVPAGGGSVFAALHQYNSDSFKFPLVAPRGSFLADSRSSSIRFENNLSTRRASVEDQSAVSENGVSVPSSPSGGHPKYASPISGSLFVPPKLSLLPPTPSPSSTSSSTAVTNSGATSPPTSPTTDSVSPLAGPLAPGGSFFTRPPNRFRSPSSASAMTTATNHTSDIMEMNDPGHAGRAVTVSIEPVLQQPLYSLYVPPPIMTAAKKSHPPLSPSAAIAHAPPATTPATSNGESEEDEEEDEDEEDDEDKAEGDGGANTTASELLPAQPQDQQDGTSGTDSENGNLVNTTAPKRKNVFLRLFQKPTPLTSPSSTLATKKTKKARKEQQQLAAPVLTPTPPAPILFHRTNHPTTRISEGEEEEDAEDMNKLKK